MERRTNNGVQVLNVYFYESTQAKEIVLDLTNVSRSNFYVSINHSLNQIGVGVLGSIVSAT